MKTLRESLTALGVFGPVVWLCAVWRTLPAKLPSHFGMDGLPNSYASRNLVWALVGISAALYFALLVMQQFPNKMNLPYRLGDPERPRVEALGVELIGWLRLEIAWTFAYLMWSMIEVGAHRRDGLGTGFVFVCVGAVMATVVGFLIRMKKRA